MMDKVKLNLVGHGDNAHGLLSAFAKAAGKQGWSYDQIREVTDKATEGDYDHLLRTLIKYTTAE
jgi:hypothetical protein